MTELFLEWQSYIALLLGGLLTALGVVSTTIFNNTKDITILKQLVNSLISERKDHDTKVDIQLGEIRTDIKNLLARK